ncbi:hypothetical protein IMZ48_03450 [Candidatus Bathyarchaeota archaeon]|nr:hypothetical protein [Candidatus Bathyarchaeota archaeon]
MNVVTHKCNGDAARVAISKFGKKFVQEARWEVMSQLSPAAPQEMEKTVVDKAPDTLLDLAIQKRLPTIRPRPLLNMLAKSERLGYDASDIISDHPEPAPRSNGVPNNNPWIPTAPPGLGAQQSPALGAQPSPGPGLGAQPSPGPGLGARPSQPRPPPTQGGSCDILTCPLCRKRFPSEMTRDHVSPCPRYKHIPGRRRSCILTWSQHYKKQICQKPRASSNIFCPRCDQSFATPSGLDYHKRHFVCGRDGAMPAAASPNLMASSAGSSPASFTPTQLPSSHPQAQPGRPGGPGTPSTAGPPPGTRVTPVYPPQYPQPTSGPRPTPGPSSTPGPKPTAPAASQTPSSQTRSDYDPYSHLSKEQYCQFEQELTEHELNYKPKWESVRRDFPDPVDQLRETEIMKNRFATKQSMIRKKYGVRLRIRRSKEVIKEERRRMGIPSPHGHGSQVPQVRSRSPPGSSDAHASKRARTGMDGQSVATQGHAAQETPTRKHAASADVAAPLSGGLGPAAAAPEMMDPTRLGGHSASQPTTYGAPRLAPPTYGGVPPRPASQARPAAQPSTQPAPAKPVHSPMKALARSTAIEVSSNTETDSDSDSDDDTIPAQLPPPPLRATKGLSKPW